MSDEDEIERKVFPQVTVKTELTHDDSTDDYTSFQNLSAQVESGAAGESYDEQSSKAFISGSDYAPAAPIEDGGDEEYNNREEDDEHHDEHHETSFGQIKGFGDSQGEREVDDGEEENANESAVDGEERQTAEGEQQEAAEESQEGEEVRAMEEHPSHEDEDNGEATLKRKRVLLSSDDEDGDGAAGDEDATGGGERTSGGQDNEEEKGEEREGEVGNLIAHIFGDESDEEKDEEGEKEEGEREGGRAERDEGEEEEEEDRPARPRSVDEDDDDQTTEWDFDRMLAMKKAEKTKKKRRRRKDGGIDIINDDDGTITLLVEQMKLAAKEDRHSNMERKPALRKRVMLPTVRAHLLRADLYEVLLDGGMMSAISEWLAPLPDKSLPALEIRSDILRILQSYSRLDQSILKQSGLGKAVMLLFKHPRETKENKKMASKLISEWARPIFQLDTRDDFSREDRSQRDLENMPQAKKRRLSSDEGAGPSNAGDDVLTPGQKGFIGRARVPKPSNKDYVIRPRSSVEGTFKESKSRTYSRLDKASRDFKERTRKLKVQRAVNVSLEGRRMDI